jgi:hypothetical protein
MLEADEGRREEALHEYQESKRIMQELTKRDPGNAGWLRDLAASHNRMGRVLAELPGRQDEALAEHLKSQEIAEHLVKVDPGRQQWVADLEVYRDRVHSLRQRIAATTAQAASAE